MHTRGCTDDSAGASATPGRLAWGAPQAGPGAISGGLQRSRGLRHGAQLRRGAHTEEAGHGAGRASSADPQPSPRRRDTAGRATPRAHVGPNPEHSEPSNERAEGRQVHRVGSQNEGVSLFTKGKCVSAKPSSLPLPPPSDVILRPRPFTFGALGALPAAWCAQGRERAIASQSMASAPSVNDVPGEGGGQAGNHPTLVDRPGSASRTTLLVKSSHCALFRRTSSTSSRTRDSA